MIREKDITNEISYLQENIQRVYSELEKIKKTVPEGVKLRAVLHGKGYQYFMRRQGKRDNGEYIKKNDIKTAEKLAQIEYDEKLIIIMQEAIDALTGCKESGINDVFEYALSHMAPGKRELVEHLYISDQCFIKEWKEQEFEKLPFREGASEFYTRRGLRVRSKSEVIIADILDELDIPFQYEKPLKLKNCTIHPDFTLLNMRERKEIYWEHFGMMDDREYRDNAFQKIREYEENGLFQYDSVIWTFETGRYPLNIREIRKMAEVLKTRLS